MKFYLGTHQPGWLARTDTPLFVSDVRLSKYRTLPRAQGRWALDSGGFSMLSVHGTWAAGPTPQEYAARVRRYRDEVGGLDWAAIQDWMCESFIVAKTGLSVTEHQRRTIGSYLTLSAIAPDLPWALVIQGEHLRDYVRCAQMYVDAGIDIAAAPVVGVGSVCRRQGTSAAAQIIQTLTMLYPGIKLHGFGVKTTGLAHYGDHLASADSMAWSYDARRNPPLPGCSAHINCANCIHYAMRWREKVLAGVQPPPAQFSVFDIRGAA